LKIIKLAQTTDPKILETLEDIYSALGGNRWRSPSGTVVNDYVEIRTEALGTAYIQIRYSEIENAMVIEKYYDNENLQNEYGSTVSIPFVPDSKQMIAKISGIVSKLK
jgi:hypothetical protein